MEVQALSPEIIQDTLTPPSPQPTPIPASQISTTFSTSIDLLSSRLPTRILHTTDAFFCAPSNLLTPTPPIHKPATYTPQGAWYDGWETRRHNPSPPDSVIFRLGVPAGRVKGVEIDTGFFDGNHAEYVSVEGLFIDTGDAERDDEEVLERGRWGVVMPPRMCEGKTRHAWLLPTTSSKKRAKYTHIRLNMHPDGGIARFRLYGSVIPHYPIPTSSSSTPTNPPTPDLASLLNGAIALTASNAHFSPASNLLLPGRGSDMSDGWETGRSRGRGPGEGDWVIIRLGSGCEWWDGGLERVVVDTAFFRGNFPERCAISVAVEVGAGTEQGGEQEREDEDEDEEKVREHPPHEKFVRILEPTKLGADKEHEFMGKELRLDGLEKGNPVRWVKMEIFPDGGVKRLRVFGRRHVPGPAP